jgi:hypothetical protein
MGTANRVDAHFVETLLNLSLSVKDHPPFATKVPSSGASSQMVTLQSSQFLS